MNFTDWSEEITKNLKQAQEQYWKSMAEQRAKPGSDPASDIPKMAAKKTSQSMPLAIY